jgi:hypothetical protein
VLIVNKLRCERWLNDGVDGVPREILAFASLVAQAQDAPPPHVADPDCRDPPTKDRGAASGRAKDRLRQKNNLAIGKYPRPLRSPMECGAIQFYAAGGEYPEMAGDHHETIDHRFHAAGIDPRLRLRKAVPSRAVS